VYVRAPEHAIPVVRRGAHHARVVPAAWTAKEPVVGDAERRARGVKLADPVLAQLVLLVPGQVGQLGRDDLAEFAQRARDEGHACARWGVFGGGGPGAICLSVGGGGQKQPPPVTRVLVHAARIANASAAPYWQDLRHERHFPPPASPDQAILTWRAALVPGQP